MSYLKYLAIAALFILLIAWINYVNLSTARALDRSKEVGVRKVVGANRFQLIRQFMTESVFVNILALVIGITLFNLALNPFALLVQKKSIGFGIDGNPILDHDREHIPGGNFFSRILSCFCDVFIQAHSNPQVISRLWRGGSE